MLAASLSSFWPSFTRENVAPDRPRKRSAPIFIGDSVQPFAGETLLLSILRADGIADHDTDN